VAGDNDMSAQASPQAEQKLAELLKTLTEHADELQSLLINCWSSRDQASWTR